MVKRCIERGAIILMIAAQGAVPCAAREALLTFDFGKGSKSPGENYDKVNYEET